MDRTIFKWFWYYDKHKVKVMKEERLGLIFGISAFCLWGFLVVFFKQFNGVNPYEIVAHRVLWSVLVLLLVLVYLRRISSLIKILLNFNVTFWLFISGLLLSSSWCIFVYTVDAGLVLEAGFGNFISPLLSILIGCFALKENITNGAKVAVFFVVLAILIQSLTLGSLPVLSILLATIVAIYGLIKKKIRVAALEGLFVENLLITPIAMTYFLYLLHSSQSHFMADLNGFLLILCGPVTVVPLLLFSAATTRINLSTMGYLQYINPSISILLAIFLYGESVGIYKIISFCLIWVALAIITLEGFYKYKKGHK